MEKFIFRKISVCIEKNLRKIDSVLELSEEASQMMESVFYETFIVNNDLINKNIVSGAIRQAREKALNLIIDEEDFIEACHKLSPEHSIIRSVLSKNGLCVEEDITPADLNLKSSKSADQLLKTCIKKCIKARRPVFEIVEQLKNPPYGLRDGYISILFANELRNYENVSFYFHETEKDYSVETLLAALNQPTEYSLYICDWDQEQKQFISKLEDMFGKYINVSSKNRLKELFVAMNRHYTTIAKSARTTNKYVSDRTKKYRDIMSMTHKDYNAFFFEILFELGTDYDEITQVIKKAKIELESVVEHQIFSIKNIIGNSFGLEQKFAWKELKNKYLADWEIKKQRLLDYQITAVFEVIKTETSEDDYIWINHIANAVTGFEVEYWNDDKEVELADCLDRIIKQFKETSLSFETSESEIRLILEGDGNQKVAQFNNGELSTASQVMFNKMKSTFEHFGQSMSTEEKMHVLTKLLSEFM